MIQKLKTQNDMILLIIPSVYCFRQALEGRELGGCGKCQGAPASYRWTPESHLSSKRLLADENAVTSGHFGVDWMCSKVWVPKPPKRATALHLRDPKGLHWKLPTSCWWGHCNSWSLVPHFKFPIWSNVCISYNLIQVLINLIYRIKIQNFLSSDHSNTSRASED